MSDMMNAVRAEAGARSETVSPLEQAMNAQRMAISDLDGELRLLLTQLDPVMQPVPEDSAAKAMLHDPSPPRSPHVADLHDQNDRLAELIERCRGIRAYLDLR